MTREPGTHGYICECNLRTCGETIYIRHDTYRRVSCYGTLLSKTCARREDRLVMGDYGEYVVVATTGATPGILHFGMDKSPVAY